ncbi:MAG: hypothetical protein K0Q91_161 [Fibrobacteria bacterium]|jgi:hypothetical protein|nr:hypothetical protein [Fibrobacteria bacterium]
MAHRAIGLLGGLVLTGCALRSFHVGGDRRELDWLDDAHPREEKLLMAENTLLTETQSDGTGPRDFGQGLYLDPYVRFVPDSGAAHAPGIRIHHHTQGVARSFNPIESVQLGVPSGRCIELESWRVSGGDDPTFLEMTNSILGAFDTENPEPPEPETYSEYALAPVSWENLRVLADSGVAWARFHGGQRYKTYGQEDIDSGFSGRLRAFLKAAEAKGLMRADTVRMDSLHAAYTRVALERKLAMQRAREDSIRQAEVRIAARRARRDSLEILRMKRRGSDNFGGYRSGL